MDEIREILDKIFENNIKEDLTPTEFDKMCGISAPECKEDITNSEWFKKIEAILNNKEEFPFNNTSPNTQASDTDFLQEVLIKKFAPEYFINLVDKYITPPKKGANEYEPSFSLTPSFFKNITTEKTENNTFQTNNSTQNIEQKTNKITENNESKIFQTNNSTENFEQNKNEVVEEFDEQNENFENNTTNTTNAINNNFNIYFSTNGGNINCIEPEDVNVLGQMIADAIKVELEATGHASGY